MPDHGLQNRWDDESIGLVLKRLRSDEPPDVFGRTADGKWDLRCFVIGEILRSVSMVDIDLSSCSVQRGGQLIGCTLTNVDLPRSKLTTNIDGVFTNCSFENSNLTAALFRGKFIDCSFMKAKLRNATGESVTFTNCCFDDANFHGAHLCGCRFGSCTWNGSRFGDSSLYRSQFTGGFPNDVGNTIMDHVEVI